MRVRSIVTAALAAAFLIPSPPPAAAVEPVGLVHVDAEISYPYFPCDFLTTTDCAAPVTGSLEGTLAGVDGGTVWKVSFEDADVSSSSGYATLWLLVGPPAEALGFCRYEANYTDVTTRTTAVSGTYGAQPVEAVRVTGLLHFLRVGDRLAIALEGATVTLELPGGEVAPLAGDELIGAGQWEPVSGAPGDECLTFEHGPPLTADVTADMTVNPDD